MKRISFLLVLPLIVLLVGCENNKIDVTNTGFKYDVESCDEYFQLIECIINKDTDERFTKQMRIELKNEVKQMQEEWKQLDEKELTKKCTEELENYKNGIKEKNLNDFGCIKKN